MKSFLILAACGWAGLASAQLEQQYTKSGPLSGSGTDQCAPQSGQEPAARTTGEYPGNPDAYAKPVHAPVRAREVILRVDASGNVVDCVFQGEPAEYYAGDWVYYRDEWYQIRQDPSRGKEAAYPYSHPGCAGVTVVRQRSN